MSSSSPSPLSLVVVTGANGYVGLHVLKYMMAHSPASKVRAVTRNEKSAESVREVFSAALEKGHLEIVYVPDILADGAYSDALQGADGVLHIASPVPSDKIKDNAKDLLQPAKEGVLNLLKAASEVSSIKKVVLCSSSAAMYDTANQPIGPASWNPITYEQAVKTEDRLEAYMASKTFAEQAAWDFIKEKKPAFALTALCPVVVIGRTLLPAPVQSTTNRMLWEAATEGKNGLGNSIGYCDVRDIAKAHIQALVSHQTDGKRYLLWTETVSDVEVAELAQEHFPKQQWKKPAAEDNRVKIETDLSDLDLELRSIRETIKEVFEIELKRMGAL